MEYEKLIYDEFNSPEIKHCLIIDFERIIKSVKLATKIRILGNKLYTECKHNNIMHQRIWDSYLCSIALSPNDSEMLATSYGNMSALMFHLSKYQDCINNIEEALKITESIALKVKLLCRKAKCLSAMGISEKDKIFDEARTWLNKIDDNDKMKVDLIQLVDKAKIVLDKNKVKVERTTSNESHVDFFNENEILKNVKNKKRRKNNLKFNHLINLAVKETESVFNSVDLTYNDEYGWHLTATRDIQPGEIIFVVKPYVVVQNFTKSQNFCNNCLNVIWTGIPCKACAYCMFCSKKCHDEAMEKYHSIECPILQFVVSGDSWLDYHIQASLRAVVMGVKEFGSITNLRDKINEFDSFPDDTEYRNYHTSFISLLGFKNIHVEPEILSDLAAACCKTVICLSKFTSFFNSDRKFDTIENFTENEDIKFIAVLLLKIAVIIFNNGIKVTESGLFCKTYVDSAKCSSVVPCCEKGISMNTLSQFIPHSCDPNVKAMKVNNCKEIYYALLPISEGDLILECYKNTFYECEFTQRQQEISRILNRNCTCLACQENWPALLIDDSKIMSIEYLMKIVIASRKHNNQKQKLFNLIKEHGIAHQNIVSELSKAIKINYNNFGQPSLQVCAAIYALRFVFNELYEIKLNMPNTCKTGQI